MKAVPLFTAFLFTLTLTSTSFGHSGGTNAMGCHTNHRTGDYHCHTPKTPPPQRVLYCHIVNGESRCGYALSTCSSLVSQYGGQCVQQ